MERNPLSKYPTTIEIDRNPRNSRLSNRRDLQESPE
jgi:hypothetical protein